MIFSFDARPSDSPFVETIWRTQSDSSTGSSFMSMAATNWEIVVTRQRDKTWLSLRGPETKASPAPIPQDAEFFGIVFKLGTFMPHLPPPRLVNGGLHLSEGAGRSFWLHGASWEIPSFDNADTFIDRLVRNSLLVREPVVEAALRGHLKEISLRSVQRRFLRATGLTHTTIFQIERARRALTLLQQGVPILDTVDLAGYADQPHLTRALRRFMGHTPAQILRLDTEFSYV